MFTCRSIKGNMYSMVCLDTEKYAKAFDNMSQLDEGFAYNFVRAKVGFDGWMQKLKSCVKIKQVNAKAHLSNLYLLQWG